MKKYLYFLILFAVTSFIFIGCSTKADEEKNTIVPGVTKGKVDITVHVIDNSSSENIDNATVTITGSPSAYEYSTNGSGNINLSFENDKSRDLVIITTKKGYYVDTTHVSVSLDDEITVTIKLQVKIVNSEVSGPPASIALLSTSAQNIGIKTSGAIESATMLFQVMDSTGNAIDITHSVFVSFHFGDHPGGQEFLGPDSTKTNAQGQVYVNLNSGYKAGVVQIHAEIQPDGKTINKKIISKPVNISIHGGHPDQAHFSIAPKYLNIHGWAMNNVEDPITAIVGDAFSNPVKPLTAVYFNTNGGVIEGSALTNNDGMGTVKLFSGNPRPGLFGNQDGYLADGNGVLHGPGYLKVNGFSADSNQNKVTDYCNIVFSGPPIIELTEEDRNQTNITHLSHKNYNFTIKDANGNPISSFHHVTVLLKGDGLSLDGDINFDMPDVLFPGPGHTEFSFTVFDVDKLTFLGARTYYIQIIVTGPYTARATSRVINVDQQ